MSNILSKEANVIGFLMDIKEKKKLAVSFSGGKDSLVALDLSIKAGIENVVFANTTIEFDENINFIDEIQDYYGVDIKRVKAPINFFEMVNRVGFPSRRLRWCCDVFKFGPLAKYSRKNDINGFITGIRGDESLKRKEYIKVDANPLVPTSQINPLINWSRNDVQKYIDKYDLPINPLYKYVNRLGCWCCPFRSEKEWKEIEENFPDLMKKLRKELHKFAERIGIENKEKFIDDRKWTGWATPQKKINVGAMKKENNNLKEILFYGNNGYGERILKLLPIVTDNFYLDGKNIKINLGLIRQKKLDILIEKAMNCIGCGACTSVCPHGALEIENKKLNVKEDKCNNCMICLNTQVLKGACVVRNYSPKRRTLTSYN